MSEFEMSESQDTDFYAFLLGENLQMISEIGSPKREWNIIIWPLLVDYTT